MSFVNPYEILLFEDSHFSDHIFLHYDIWIDGKSREGCFAL